MIWLSERRMLTCLSPCGVPVQVWGDMMGDFKLNVNLKENFNSALTAARTLLPDVQALKSKVNFNFNVNVNKTPGDKTQGDDVKVSRRPMHGQTLDRRHRYTIYACCFRYTKCPLFPPQNREPATCPLTLLVPLPLYR